MQKRIIVLPENWLPTFLAAAREYQEQLGQPFLGEAYYRAAFEVGVNLQRPKEGLRLAEMAQALVPENPKLLRLLDRLRRPLPAPITAPRP